MLPLPAVMVPTSVSDFCACDWIVAKAKKKIKTINIKIYAAAAAERLAEATQTIKGVAPVPDLLQRAARMISISISVLLLSFSGKGTGKTS